MTSTHHIKGKKYYLVQAPCDVSTKLPIIAKLYEAGNPVAIKSGLIRNTQEDVDKFLLTL